MTSSARAVGVALAVDCVIGAAKVVAFAATGSAAVLAELLHSGADITNQAMLAIGIRRSRRAPDDRHPYGFGRSRYIWALLSATGVLFVGAGMSVVHGAAQVWSPQPLTHVRWGVGILVVSLLTEAVSLGVALSAVRASARASDRTVWQYIRSGPDPVAVAVVLEDASAVIGAGLAVAGLSLSVITGNAAWDGAASVSIGVLLAASAVFLIRRNQELLLGPAPPSEAVDEMVALLADDPLVARVLDVKVSQLGADAVRFKAEVTFDGQALARRLLTARDLDAQLAGLHDTSDLEALLVAFGGEVTDAMGDEVDRLEARLKTVAPEARHVDIEPD